MPIPNAHESPSRGPQPPAPDPERGAEPGLARVARAAIRNTPWLIIAATFHLLAIAVLSVVYVSSHAREAEPAAPTVARIVEPVETEPLPDLTSTDVVARDSVPAPSEDQAGPLNADDIIIPNADPGPRGERTVETDPDEEPGVFNPDPEARPDLPSGAPGGTAIGVGRTGHAGSGTPSAFVSRVAGGGGRGRGGRGDGGGGGPGGGTRRKDTETAVLAALAWLKNHQSPGGHWDCDGFDAHCKTNRCDGAGDGSYDVGVTGLALLAFLGAGETHQSGPFKETVKNGLKYLRDVQDSEGCFGPRTSQHFLYNHACAALAMTEAYGMTGSRVFKEPATRGVGFVLKARNPYLAWRYSVPPDGDNDTSLTGWMVMVLKSAVMSGIEVEKSAITDAVVWVDKMTEPEFGRTGYRERGGPPARTNAMMTKFPADKSESLTAVGVLTRIFAGHTPTGANADEFIVKGADLMLKKLPKWDVDAGTIDFYSWYYGSLAMFQVGGEHWKRWNEAMKSALLDHQRLEKGRDEYGSWDPVDPWSPEGGRVYATAINCLTMEVYYRYPRAFGTK